MGPKILAAIWTTDYTSNIGMIYLPTFICFLFSKMRDGCICLLVTWSFWVPRPSGIIWERWPASCEAWMCQIRQEQRPQILQHFWVGFMEDPKHYMRNIASSCIKATDYSSPNSRLRTLFRTEITYICAVLRASPGISKYHLNTSPLQNLHK